MDIVRPQGAVCKGQGRKLEKPVTARCMPKHRRELQPATLTMNPHTSVRISQRTKPCETEGTGDETRHHQKAD